MELCGESRSLIELVRVFKPDKLRDRYVAGNAGSEASMPDEAAASEAMVSADSR